MTSELVYDLDPGWILPIWIVGFGGPVCGVLIVIMMVHILYKSKHQETPIPKPILAFNTIFCTCYALSCFLYGIGRHTLYSNIFVLFDCRPWYVGGVFTYTLGKFVMYGSFVNRLHYTFRGSVLKYSFKKCLLPAIVFWTMVWAVGVALYVYTIWTGTGLKYVSDEIDTRLSYNLWKTDRIGLCGIAGDGEFSQLQSIILGGAILIDWVISLSVLFMFLNRLKMV